MTIAMRWEDPRGLCKLCESGPAMDRTQSLCESCCQKCAVFTKRHLSWPDNILPDGSDIENLPENDPVHLQYVAGIQAVFGEWDRLADRRFTSDEISLWVASVLATASSRKWLKVEETIV